MIEGVPVGYAFPTQASICSPSIEESGAAILTSIFITSSFSTNRTRSHLALDSPIMFFDSSQFEKSSSPLPGAKARDLLAAVIFSQNKITCWPDVVYYTSYTPRNPLSLLTISTLYSQRSARSMVRDPLLLQPAAG